MSEIAATIDRIRLVAKDRGGLALLAQEAGVPYSTVHSLAKRDWSSNSLDVLEKLLGAADRIKAQRDAAA